LEKLPSSIGVMADDLMAGIYANAATWLIVLLAAGIADRMIK
jgi:phosphatidylglycerophosphatase A